MDGLLLTCERVLQLHAESLQAHGGAPGLPQGEGCVEGALGAAYNAEAYTEAASTSRAGLVYAVAILFYLAHKHCFTDGNKRVAWASFIDVLAYLGLTVDASDDEAVAFVTDVVEHRLDQPHARLWVARRLAALP